MCVFLVVKYPPQRCVSDAMITTVTDRRFNTKYVKNKLQQFQRDQGLTPDGIAGSNTLLRLNALSGEPMPRLEEAS